MARFLLDSSVLIDHLRGHPDVLARIATLAAEGHDLCICAVNVAEVSSGMLEHERPATERLLSALRFLDIDYDTAWRAGEIRAQLLKQGKDASVADMLIAAVALTCDATLLTGNLRDFPITGLSVEALPSRRRHR
jgi:predicted nucleic acid-binding protein